MTDSEQQVKQGYIPLVTLIILGEFVEFSCNVTSKGTSAFSLFSLFYVLGNFSHQHFVKLQKNRQCLGFTDFTVVLLASVDGWSAW